ncbi:MAG TPA: hypothetical protein VEU51_06810 [Candidatus Acidoferrales bacterium]|nr:hypothetical protein [Candidatus Acidoferrales bacterium]
MEQRRPIFASSKLVSRHEDRIVEHELDMVRLAEPRAPVSGRVAKLFQWLMPAARVVGPPMRSVARELEETYPGRDV